MGPSCCGSTSPPDVERARAVGDANAHVVRECEAEEESLELVEARRLARQDAQPEIDLGLRGHPHRASASRGCVRGHASGVSRTGLPMVPPSLDFPRSALPMSPIEKPARMKYHAPISVMGI